MPDMLLTLLFIALVVVFVVDLSGAVENLKRLIWRLRRKGEPYEPYSLKPLDCSLCMTWWITLAAALICKGLTWPVAAYCAGLAFLTPVLAAALRLFRDLLALAVDKLTELIEKI